MATDKTAPRKGSKAEFIELLTRTLAHPKCPWTVYQAITDELIELTNSGGSLSSKEYVTYALSCDSEAYQLETKRRLGYAPAEPEETPETPEAAPVEVHRATEQPATQVTQTRIAELERRRDGLYEPSDEAARFKVEREIYDLRNNLAPDNDEWSDLICAGGDQ